MDFSFEKVDHVTASKIVSWKYPEPYHVYNVHGSEAALSGLVKGPYYAVFSDQELVGFFCYGSAARLRGKKDDALYRTGEYLDVGLGMHPAWCGKGFGSGFVRAGLLFARTQGWQKGFRLTVASNNKRAIKVYSRLGFKELGFIPWPSSVRYGFLVMTLDTLWPVPPVSEVD